MWLLPASRWAEYKLPPQMLQRGLNPRAHRGSGFADFNGDGGIDVVVSAAGGPAELWENTSPGANTWLILKLEGTKSNRDAIGAEVRIGSQMNHMTTSVGYVSSSPFRSALRDWKRSKTRSCGNQVASRHCSDPA